MKCLPPRFPADIPEICREGSDRELCDLTDHLLTPEWQQRWGISELERLVVPELVRRLRLSTPVRRNSIPLQEVIPVQNVVDDRSGRSFAIGHVSWLWSCGCALTQDDPLPGWTPVRWSPVPCDGHRWYLAEARTTCGRCDHSIFEHATPGQETLPCGRPGCGCPSYQEYLL